MNNICFIIAHKYFRGYTSYLKYYIENIQKFYPEALTLVVDNNSKYKEDVFSLVEGKDRVVLLDNNSNSKFELGAYQVGLEYILNNNLNNDYEYFVFSQDNFILKNKYEFSILKENNIDACPIVSWKNDWEKKDVWVPVLESLSLLDGLLEKTRLCWCISFILSKRKILSMYEMLTNIAVKTRHESEGSERYLGRILYELNEHRIFDIDGDIDLLDYYCHTVNVEQDTKHYFCKISQQKTENTKGVL